MSARTIEARIAILELPEPDLVEKLECASPEALGRKAAKFDLDQHIIEDAAPVEQNRVLKHDPEVRLRPRHGIAAEVHLAAARSCQSRDQPKQGALAAARWAHDGDELTLVDPEIDPVQGVGLDVAAAERLADRFDRDVSRALGGRFRPNQPEVTHVGSRPARDHRGRNSFV
jgi:hypothetical protein